MYADAQACLSAIKNLDSLTRDRHRDFRSHVASFRQKPEPVLRQEAQAGAKQQKDEEPQT
jgi:hypothetical protein